MDDTIAAIATAPGKGGIAVVRISGNEAFSIAEKMFVPSGKTRAEDFEAYRLYPGRIETENFTDYGLCVYFKAPASYTGENVAEFQCHGGENIARGVLSRAFSLGARPAERGEFTRRAFLNGKLSLASAEGIADMINGESDAEVRAGYLLYSEKLTEKVRAAQAELKEIEAGIGAAVDYPEEGIEEDILPAVAEKLRRVLSETETLVGGYSAGKKIKTGVTVAICGKPNTGKSSLLNRLLGYDKAIVSDVAGTTRDAVEGALEIDGVRFNLCDTAGIRESGDRIEKIGVDRAEKIIRAADVAVFVADGTAAEDEEDARILRLLADKPLIRVVNKIDLICDNANAEAEKTTDSGKASRKGDAYLSAATGEGVGRLKELLYEKGYGARGEDAAFLIEERHYRALRRAENALQRAVAGTGTQPLDLTELDVREAWSAFGEITGETVSEAIFEEIFSKFCVGK